MGLRTINVFSGRYNKMAIVRERVDYLDYMPVMRSPVTRLYTKPTDRMSKSDMLDALLTRNHARARYEFKPLYIEKPIIVDSIKISERLSSVDGLAVLLKNSNRKAIEDILDTPDQGMKLNINYRLIMGLARTTSDQGIISALSRYPIEDIRAEIAANTAAAPDILVRLCDDPSSIVRGFIEPTSQLPLQGLARLLSHGVRIETNVLQRSIDKLLPSQYEPNDGLAIAMDGMSSLQIAALIEFANPVDKVEITERIKKDKRINVLKEIRNPKVLFGVIHEIILPTFSQLSVALNHNEQHNFSYNLRKICLSLFGDLKAFETMKNEFKRNNARSFAASFADIQSFKAEIIDMLLNLGRGDVYQLDNGSEFALLDKISSMLRSKKEQSVVPKAAADFNEKMEKRNIDALVDKFNACRFPQFTVVCKETIDFASLAYEIQDAILGHPRLLNEVAAVLREVKEMMRDK